MLFIVDSGFSNLSVEHYVGPPTNGCHGYNLHTVIQHINPDVDIRLIDLGQGATAKSIIHAIGYILSQENIADCVVCFSATAPHTTALDNKISELASVCTVIASAGNNAQDITALLPAGSSKVITVGSLNKSKLIASHNSVGHIDVYAPGTNINVNGSKVNGTSVAMAIYSGYYSLYRASASMYISEHFDNMIITKYSNAID
jgi:hypothetical protein